MRTIGRGTLLAAGALGLALAAAGQGPTTGAFAAAQVPELDLASVSMVDYLLVEAGQEAALVDPATGEAPSNCRTGELRITARTGSLLFENITGHACLLQGHPRVTVTTGTLAPTGIPAAATLLAPGEKLRAAVGPAGKPCGTTVRVPGYRVSAPGDPTQVSIRAPHQACTTAEVGAFTP